jgi:hypothetical protein
LGYNIPKKASKDDNDSEEGAEDDNPMRSETIEIECPQHLSSMVDDLDLDTEQMARKAQRMRDLWNNSR